MFLTFITLTIDLPAHNREFKIQILQAFESSLSIRLADVNTVEIAWIRCIHMQFGGVRGRREVVRTLSMAEGQVSCRSDDERRGQHDVLSEYGGVQSFTRIESFVDFDWLMD